MFEQGIMGPKYLEYDLEMDVWVSDKTIPCCPWNSFPEGRVLATGGTEHGFVKHKVISFSLIVPPNE